MADSSIEWLDGGKTWNPIRGCSRVSEGCRHCYAETMAARIVRMGKGKPTKYDGLIKARDPMVFYDTRWTGKVAFDAKALAEPLRWRKPQRVFVNSMSDLFHDGFSNEQIAAVFGVMAACPRHTFIVLTKRARRMREWFEWIAPMDVGDIVSAAMSNLGEHAFDDNLICAVANVVNGWSAWRDQPDDNPLDGSVRRWPLTNVILGVSVENQAAADERIPDLLATPAAVRAISAEPLLGPLRLDDGESGWLTCGGPRATGDESQCCESHYVNGFHFRGIDWVIAGCESGPGARACEVSWLRSLRDQCAEAGVPFFLKQARATYPTRASWEAEQESPETGGIVSTAPTPIVQGPNSTRKPGGIIGAPYLDGVQHLAFPEVRR